MNEDQLKQIEDLIVKAVQSGKQETSGLADEVLKKIEPTIEKSMDKNFNGKMGRLDQKLTDHVVSFDEFKDEIREMFKDKETRINTLEKGKIQIWTAISVLLLFGGAIITLSIMAIDSKVKEANRESISSPEFKQVLEKSVEEILSKYDIEYKPYEER